MRREDEALLAYFRQKPACEGCGGTNGWGLDPHHILTKGAGGGDTALNLIALCRFCHTKLQEGRAGRDRCLQIVAHREGLSGPEEVWDALLRKRLQPKGAS